jgi:hypothetical protein
MINYCLGAPFLIWREAFHTYSFVNALCGCDKDTNGPSDNETITMVIDGLVLPALSSWISFFIQSKTKTMVVYTFCALMLCSVQSFSPGKALLDHHHHRRPSPSPSLLKQSSKPNELFDSPGWESIKLELDQVPVFSVANAEGQPIKYRIEKKDETFEVPLFYTHVADALAELEKAKDNNPLPGMDINPYPLGDIFEMWAKDSA